MSCPISARAVVHALTPATHAALRPNKACDQRGDDPPSYVMWTPLVYSPSGRFHGIVQKLNASLSSWSVTVRGVCAKAAPTGAARHTTVAASGQMFTPY